MYRVGLMIVSCLSLLLGGTGVAAAIDQSAVFNVAPITDGLPVTAGTKTFFNLHVKAGTTYQLPVKLSNPSNSVQKLTLQLNNAQTSANGVIDYSQANTTLLDKNAPNLAAMVVGDRQQKVTLQPNTEQTVQFMIKTPITAFAGTILGGLVVTNEGSGNTTIRSRTRYALSVALAEVGAAMPAPQLTAGPVKYVQQTTDGYQLLLRNVPPLLWHSARATLTIRNAQQQKVAYTQLTNFSLAPRSATTVILPHKRMAAGQYTYHVQLVAGTQRVTVKRKFSVKAAPPHHAVLNKISEVHTDWWAWSGIGLLAAIIIGGSIYWCRRHD